MAQSKKKSMVEAVTNTAVGFVINFCINFLVLGSLGFKLSAGKNLVITGIFTVISIARGYCIRRYFNKAEKCNTAQDEYCRNELMQLDYCFREGE